MGASGGAIVGVAIGGVSGALIGMGIPEFEAKRYEGLVKRAGILLSIHSDDSDWAEKAKMILKQRRIPEHTIHKNIKQFNLRASCRYDEGWYFL